MRFNGMLLMTFVAVPIFLQSWPSKKDCWVASSLLSFFFVPADPSMGLPVFVDLAFIGFTSSSPCFPSAALQVFDPLQSVFWDSASKYWTRPPNWPCRLGFPRSVVIESSSKQGLFGDSPNLWPIYESSSEQGLFRYSPSLWSLSRP